MKKVEIWVYVHDIAYMCDDVKKYHVRNTRDSLKLIESGVMSDVEVLRIGLEEIFINYRLKEDDNEI